MENTIKWLGTPESRILSIRHFREYISTLPIQEAVKQTTKNWNAGPYVKTPQLSLNDVEKFPSPWDLFSQKFFCNNMRILGVFYTLIMSDHSKNHDIRIVVSNDIIAGEVATIVFDDNHILNHSDKSLIIDKKSINNIMGEKSGTCTYF